MPVDAEQVAGMDIPQTDALQLLLHICRDPGRILHLGIGGDDDVSFLGSLDGIRTARLFDGQVNGGHEASLIVCFQ